MRYVNKWSDYRAFTHLVPFQHAVHVCGTCEDKDAATEFYIRCEYHICHLYAL